MPVRRSFLPWTRGGWAATAVLLFAQCAEAQDSTRVSRHIGGVVNVTNNGISLLPTFSLKKPAAIFDLSVGGQKLAFEPEFRFALDGKPWSFIFWGRYKLVKNDKFLVSVGAHPAFLFKTESLAAGNGNPRDRITADRYLAGELLANYSIAPRTTVGVYYLTGHGVEDDATQYTHFVTLNANFSHVPIAGKVYAKFVPQVYFLWMDGNSGYYATGTFTLAREGFPLSVQTLTNQPLDTRIPGGSDLLYNVTLIYSFYNEYEVKRPRK